MDKIVSKQKEIENMSHKSKVTIQRKSSKGALKSTMRNKGLNLYMIMQLS
ncbi:hypothetical protein [Methanosarcina lacustris]|nr:hypothetical protein [Methanosarcina lacustris]